MMHRPEIARGVNDEDNGYGSKHGERSSMSVYLNDEMGASREQRLSAPHLRREIAPLKPHRHPTTGLSKT